jgi:cell division protein FtsZ
MQSMSSDDAFKRDMAPKPRAGKSEMRPDVYEYEEQEDQWAVLRHEVEVEDMQRQDERVRSGWNQRDTGDDAITSQSHYAALEQAQHHVDIVVAGVGGGGMNAVNRMIHTRVRGVRFIVMNTDSQVLGISEAKSQICLGQHYTKGLGAGGSSAVGMRAATESTAEIRAALGDADLVFIAAGMGGGTGTGAAPVVASIAKKLGALTVGIVTLPFTFEGSRRKRIAEEGLDELGQEIDALITVPNDRLLATTGRDRSLADAFKLADDVLRQGVQGIAEVINVPGMINVDFADVRSVLREAGTALMSIGQGQGRNRAQQAADEAVAGGFLNVSIRGAKHVLFNISGGEDMTLFEVNEVAERIGIAIDDTADITFGAVVDPALKDTIRVTLIAAGMEERSTLHIPAIHLHQSHPAPVQHVQQVPQVQRPPVAPQAPIQPASRNVPPPVPPVQPGRPSASPASQPQQPQQPAPRPSSPPGRQQRSLDDLRGIRSMGRRHELSRGRQTGETGGDDEEEAINVPPFMKRFP